MSTFLARLAEVVFWLCVFDGLVVGFLWLSNRVVAAWDRWLWEAELAESAREAAKRWHPAGGRQR